MIWNPWKEIARLEEKLAKQVDAAQQTLRAIAVMETPRCSNVVRKITRMAREGLKQ
jgi:hypothetical protein